MDALLNRSNSSAAIIVNTCTVFGNLKSDRELQKECRQLCEEFADVSKPELGTLKDIGVEIMFKPEAEPVFRNPRSVPLAYRKTLLKLMKPESGKDSGEKFNSIITGHRWYLSGRTHHQVKERHAQLVTRLWRLCQYGQPTTGDTQTLTAIFGATDATPIRWMLFYYNRPCGRTQSDSSRT